MDGSLIVWGKALLGIGFTVFSLTLWRSSCYWTLSAQNFMWLATGLIGFTRISLFILLYFILDIKVPSDVPGYYVPQGHRVLLGEIPYRDFYSSYGPGFSYIIALVLSLWDSAKAIVLVAILAETASIPFWISAARKMFSEHEIRHAYLLYLANAMPLVIAAIAGQQQLWLAFFLALAWWAVVAGRTSLSGASAGLSLVLVKMLGLLLVPMLWLISRDRVRWTLGFALPLLIGYGAITALGGNPLTSLQGEIDSISSGNLPYLLNIATYLIPDLNAIFQGLLLVLLIAFFLFVYLRSPTQDARTGWHLTTLVALLFMLLSPKSPTNYLAVFLFFIAMTAVIGSKGWKNILTFGFFGVVAAVEPSLWFRWLNQVHIEVFWSSTLIQHEPVQKLQLVFFLCCEIFLVGFYLYYVQCALRRLFENKGAYGGYEF